MKTGTIVAATVMGLTLAGTNVLATNVTLDSVNIKTDVNAEKIEAINNSIVNLGSVDVSQSKINGGNLEVDTWVRAGNVKAHDDAKVNVASLLLHNGSEIGRIGTPLIQTVITDDISANNGAKIDVGTIDINASTINGDLNISGQGIYAKTGNLTANQGAQLGVASLLMEGSEAEEININRMEAHLRDVTVEQDGEAYFSTLKLANGAKAGTINFSGYSEVHGDITVPSGAKLNLASAVIDDAHVGDVDLNLYAEVDDIKMSGESTINVGAVNFR